MSNFQLAALTSTMERDRYDRKVRDRARKKIHERIWYARTSRDHRLDLNNLRLTKIPTSIFELTQLNELNLQNNLIKEVPGELSRLTHLRKLDLTNNPGLKLPDQLRTLPPLVSLNLSYCDLTDLPDWVCQLTRLEELNLFRNSLVYLPENIGGLATLQRLDVRYNRLRHLPTGFARLGKLSKLWLQGNLMDTFPPELLYLPSLQRLTFWDKLSVEGNPITNLPLELIEMKALEELYINSEAVIVPPPEVLNCGQDGRVDLMRLRAYFQQLQAGLGEVDYLYEAKLLLVGEGGAGKTTLANKLVNPNYQLKEEPSTQGINVTRWQFTTPDGHPFHVNIWDFGGQEIYHATHQFFLTKRSLYALVADSRKEDTDFFYWLNIVEQLSDNSPLLIINNQKQERRREINESGLRERFSNLKDTLDTNLAMIDKRLERVRAEIQHQICQLPHIGTPLPKTWVKVRRALEDHPNNYISRERYFQICAANGITTPEGQRQLSWVLHDLGICLHFQEDPVLDRIVILKPKWGTNAVYAALDSKQVINQQGEFTDSDLKSIWSAPDYRGMEVELLRLMINFKLCYELPEQKGTYIAPQLLTPTQPPYPWNPDNNLILLYTYDFLPKGILTQLIVAMHDYIDDQKWVWKSGVVLGNERNRAVVIENYDKREIKIRATGLFKTDIMAVILRELEKIHRNFPRLKYKQMIPCNCMECQTIQSPDLPFFFDYQTLLNFIERHRELIQCQRSGEMVNVYRLITNVMPEQNLRDIDQVQIGGSFLGQPSTHIGYLEVNGPLIVQPSKIIQNTNQIIQQEAIMSTRKENSQPKSAWANGSFYLAVFLVVILALGVLANSVPWYALALVLIFAVLFVPIIGAFQLQQDKNVSEKNFIKLITMVVGQLPWIGKVFGGNKH